MEVIFTALVVGFAAGALGALGVIDSKTNGMMKAIKTLQEMIENVETMAMNNTTAIEKHTEAVGLLKHVGEIIASDQNKSRIQIWESINNLWHEVDEMKGKPEQEKKPADEPKPEQEQKPADEPKPEQKPKAKQKRKEGAKND